MSHPRPALPAALAVLAFGLLSLVGGWLIVAGGGFFHSPGRRSSEGAFVTGAPAVLMASLQYLAATIAFTWLLRPMVSPAAAVVLAFTLVFVPPALYLLVG
ncbi:hypothetical protein [Aquabacterium sp.]|uniref:hypothetical protein n=1 Tax=Aquabacterium sp. TaxID=1872578 RepID=UPI0025BAF38B|nr:hypothetical protein [Aquabacterium sp.]